MNAFEREVIELHQFFEDWFVGRLPQTQAGFDRFGAAMSAEFSIVGPDGAHSDYGPLSDALYGAHSKQPQVKIWVDAVELRGESGEFVWGSYQEWQATAGGDPSCRISSVIFHKDPAAPNGLRWVRVHETWRHVG